MKGWIWYLALLFIGAVIIVLAFWKSKNKHTITLWFGISGICYFLESVIHTVLKAYEFTPRFVQDKYADSIWGGIISDLFALPPAAVLIGVFQLNFWWIVAISGIFYGIETLFLKLGIYEQYWWKTYYTFLAFIPLFMIAKWWYRELNRPHGRVLTFATLMSIAYMFRQQFSLHIYLHLKGGQFSIKWMESIGLKSIYFTVPINLLFAFALALLVVNRVRWYWDAALIAAFSGIDFLLYMLKWLQPKAFWLFVLLLLARVVILLICLAFDRLIRKNEVSSTLSARP